MYYRNSYQKGPHVFFLSISWLTSACPTSDRNYFLVNGKCLYIETTDMNRVDARTNCANKMAQYGKGVLLEPKSVSMSEMVSRKVQQIIGSKYLHIGVNDIVQPDTYVYESNLTPISFTPNWYAGSATHRPGNNQISYKCTFLSLYEIGEWVDYECTTQWNSICE